MSCRTYPYEAPALWVAEHVRAGERARASGRGYARRRGMHGQAQAGEGSGHGGVNGAADGEDVDLLPGVYTYEL